MDDRLYAVEANDLLEVIRTLDDQLKSVMIVGHNPALVVLAQRLSSEITDMPTCAVAEFRFDTKSWSEIGEIEPAHVALDYPKKS